jgi:hypothetical protein
MTEPTIIPKEHAPITNIAVSRPPISTRCERGDEQDAEHAHDRQHLRDHVRGVDQRLPTTTADLHGVRRHRGERQQAEQQREEVDRRLPKANLQLEAHELEDCSETLHAASERAS